MTLPAILARQIGALDREIAEARAVRERLVAMQSIIADGGQPEIDDWLASLSVMNTFEQYFGAGELKLVFERWERCQSDWPPLLQAVREAMARGVPPDSVELQPLARRWEKVVGCSKWTIPDTPRWKQQL